MVLALFILTLAIASTWQKETTEKSLNEMLDQLIEETVITTFSDENENTSRIIYLNPENTASRPQETRLNVIHSSEYKGLENLAHRIANSKLEVNPKESDENKVMQEFKVEIERTDEFNNDFSDDEAMHKLNIVNNGFSKSGTPLFEDIPDLATTSFISESQNNLIHKYPEIIIDKITKDASENINKEHNKLPFATQGHKFSVQNYDHTGNKFIEVGEEVGEEVAAKAFDSLMKILMQGRPKKNSIADSNAYLDIDDMNALIKSTHIHNAFHNHVINNVPLGYDGKILLGQLPEAYRNLHSIITRPRNVYLNPNLQLNRWESNTGQNSLMDISRAHNLNHAHFIPKPLNVMPRIVFQPFYHHHHFL